MAILDTQPLLLWVHVHAIVRTSSGGCARGPSKLPACIPPQNHSAFTVEPEPRLSSTWANLYPSCHFWCALNRQKSYPDFFLSLDKIIEVLQYRKTFRVRAIVPSPDCVLAVMLIAEARTLLHKFVYCSDRFWMEPLWWKHAWKA